MASWISLLLLLPLVAAQLGLNQRGYGYVRPNDYRMVYRWGGSSIGNFRQYRHQYPNSAVDGCTGPIRLGAEGDSVELAFKGPSLEASVLEDSAGGQVSVHLNGTVLEDPLTYGNTSVADNHCFPIHINKTGLPDQTSVASVRVNGPAPVYLYRISFTPSTNLVTTAPEVPSGYVRVLMNDSQVSYVNDSQVSPFVLYTSGDLDDSQGFWEPSLCGSFVNLWNPGSSASLQFTGTSATVNFLNNMYGRPVDVYLDGALYNSTTNIGTQPLGASCDVAPFRLSQLEAKAHNLTVVYPTSGANRWILVQSFEYTLSEDTQTSPTKPPPKKSEGPVIGGVVGGALGALLLALAFLFYRRRHKNTSTRKRHMLIDEGPAWEMRRELHSPGIIPNGQMGSPVWDTFSPTSATTGILSPEAKSPAPPPYQGFTSF